MSATPSSFGIQDERRLVPDLLRGMAKGIGFAQGANAQRVRLRVVLGARVHRRATVLQKACTRRAPLSATLTYLRGLPARMRKPSAGTGMPARKAVPESIWQSRQWQRPRTFIQ